MSKRWTNWEREAILRMTANGYGRDHGTKEIFDCEIETDDARLHATSSPAGIHISVPASITLNGKFWAHLDIAEHEVSRMFYMTHRDKDLRDIVGIFAKLKREEDEAEEARARREAEKAATYVKRRI